MKDPQRFTIIREQDTSGVSGVGRVLDGVIFHTGQVVVCWRSNHASITIFENWDAFDGVHLKAHPENRAKIQFFDSSDMPE
ncbi:hypothetical protein [Deinococcus sp. SL84]|uniref:hypothetical protein n=1 Tax=Deinococcus sp. SL84 TaxID=2994663 RepID=UPI002272A381|nr:hypothetical protein [Deinococcus sp. SL84]MCY1704276.1 hypothetical protein [Deinococcus sp. SL84]